MKQKWCEVCGERIPDDRTLCGPCDEHLKKVRAADREWERQHGEAYRAASYEAARRPRTELERKRSRFAQKRKRRYAALVQRDGEYCRVCGSKQSLTVDHIVPMSKGGGDELENLQILCHSCNARKGER